MQRTIGWPLCVKGCAICSHEARSLPSSGPEELSHDPAALSDGQIGQINHYEGI